ncbi:MAG: BamA/TamA family outer membrane protein [Candidatus Krumholzibacteria bacterium]|nr:BamA/TamA family outer membrane protein [Candidatus Krumholzibacteria bacterium]
MQLEPTFKPASAPKAMAGRARATAIARALWLVSALLLAAVPVGRAQTSPTAAPPATAPHRTLTLESIELIGTDRTSLATVLQYLPLIPGQTIDQEALVAAVAELRASELFARVDFSTGPGSSRGRVILLLEVDEHGLDWRWAAGNSDLDGWYLVPLMVEAVNPTGRGDRLDLQLRWGFRHSGLLLNYARPRVGDGRDYWAARLSAIATERPWFADGVEYRQDVQTAGVAGVYGRRWNRNWLGELGLNLAAVSTAKEARAYSDAPDGSVSFDDEIRGAALPPGIRDGLGDDFRAIVHLDVQHDTRAGELRAGSPVAGVWGRLKGETVLQGPRSHWGLQADVRSYRNAPGGALALRTRGAVVTERAPYYDRLYLGGMYSVRGFPTHSLSAPGGDTWLWSSSLEYRSRILGDARGTKLAGLLFVDAGAAGTFDGDDCPGVAVGAGYGARLRVWWLDWIGIDVGFPLTRRPIDQRFQVTASIGWSF